MFRQDRTNPSSAVSNWRGRHESSKGWPSTAVSSWLNGGLFGGAAQVYAAYFAGGYSSAGIGGKVDTVDKFAFSDDSRTTLATGLSAIRESLSGAANSGVAAYFAGGQEASGVVATVDKFDFSGDGRTTLGTGLSAARRGLAGAANSGTAAYFAGGLEQPGSVTVTTVDKFAFSDDSRSTLGTGLSTDRYDLGGAANSGTAAYFAGGYTASGGGSRLTTVDKFAFSDDSRSTLGTGLSGAESGGTAAANSGTAAYFAGGYSGGYLTTVDKFAFSDDSRTTLAAGLSAGGYLLGGAANSGTAAYFAGGDRSAVSATIDKFAFSDDSRTTLGTGLSSPTRSLAGAANSETLV